MRTSTFWNVRGIALSLVAALLSAANGYLLIASQLGKLQLRDETGTPTDDLIGSLILAVLCLGFGFWAFFPTWAVRINGLSISTYKLFFRRRVQLASLQSLAFDASTMPRSLLIRHSEGKIRVFPAPSASPTIAEALSRPLDADVSG